MGEKTLVMMYKSDRIGMGRKWLMPH